MSATNSGPTTNSAKLLVGVRPNGADALAQTFGAFFSFLMFVGLGVGIALGGWGYFFPRS